MFFERAILVICLWKLASACSPVKGYELKTFTMEQNLALASVVVSGTDVEHAPYDPNNGVSNYTFRVSCVFKSGGLDIPRTIFLIDVGATSCDGTRMETPGTSYLVGLEKATDSFITRGRGGDYFGKDSQTPIYFKVAEPEINTSGAFEASEENLRKVSQICDMDDRIRSLGQGFEGDHVCPVRNVTPETCTDASAASGLMTSQTGFKVTVMMIYFIASLLVSM